MSSIQQNKTKVKKQESDYSSRDKIVTKSRLRNKPDTEVCRQDLQNKSY